MLEIERVKVDEGRCLGSGAGRVQMRVGVGEGCQKGADKAKSPRRVPAACGQGSGSAKGAGRVQTRVRLRERSRQGADEGKSLRTVKKKVR